MGAYAEFWSFDFVPQAMQNRRFDCAMTGVIHANERRWNELADYMVGPLASFPFATNVINWRVWASIPGDLQDILIEEAAKSELEALRLASIQNEVGLTGLQEAGTELVPFSEAVSSSPCEKQCSKRKSSLTTSIIAITVLLEPISHQCD